jgi:dUTP pyrophosphatase
MNSIITAHNMSLYTNAIDIQCMLLDPKATLPHRAHPTDAGADLRSCEDVTVLPNSIQLVNTGVGIKVPTGYAGLVYNRSGQGSRGILVANSVGVIDSDYRGPVKVALYNTTDMPYIIHVGDRIAQLLIQKIELSQFRDIWNDTQRGTQGFGSTGTK